MLKYNSFKKYLDKTDNYSVTTLKKHFKIGNYQNCLTFIIDFINHEVTHMYRLDKKNKKYIFKAFKFLNYPNNYREIKDFRLLEEKLALLLDNIYIVSLDGDNKINSFLEIVAKNAELLREQFDYSSDSVQNNHKNLFEFALKLIFEVRDINLCMELFKTYPDIINLQSENGDYFVSKIIDRYLNVLINHNSDYILNYYDNVVNQLFTICKSELNTFLKRDMVKRLVEVKKEQKDFRIISFLKRTIINIDDTYIFNCFEDICNIYNIPLTEPNYEINPILNENYDEVKDKLVVSIDSAQTKIRDDAFSVTKLKNDNYLLEIYAANVSNYVALGSLLDKRARGIGKTIWTSLGAINMFPDKFSKETLSLNAHEQKHAICYAFEFTRKLELVNFDIRKVLINPDYNLYFDDINRTLSVKNFQDEKLYETLSLALQFLELGEYNNTNMEEYHLLKTIRRQILNINNKNRDLENDNHNNGEKLINIFKLLVGNHVSTLIRNQDLPFIYRVNTASLGNNIQELKTQYLSGEDDKLILQIINSSLGKSYYSTENLGHKGLGLDSYSNVTISIRNYISLVCERLICKYLIDKQISDKELITLETYLKRLCEEINFRIQLNEEYVYEVSKLKKKV